MPKRLIAFAKQLEMLYRLFLCQYNRWECSEMNTVACWQNHLWLWVNCDIFFGGAVGGGWRTGCGVDKCGCPEEGHLPSMLPVGHWLLLLPLAILATHCWEFTMCQCEEYIIFNVHIYVRKVLASPFHRWANWGTELGSYLFKFTQLKPTLFPRFPH